MSDFPPRPDDVSKELYETCLAVTARRPRTVIKHILEHGFITTEELKTLYGYNHPPRAAADVRDQGVQLSTTRIKDSTGRSIGAYRFDASAIVGGRVGGRKAFPKLFKKQLIARYGARSMLTNEPLEARYLQIDHRIPYAVAGDSGEGVEEYMLLDASAQRAKSWSCENCKNFLEIKDPSICSGCFWAFPENYTHVAMRAERRLDVVWSGADVAHFETFKKESDKRNISPQELVKQIIATFLGRRK
jgi:hypothetical protein